MRNSWNRFKSVLWVLIVASGAGPAAAQLTNYLYTGGHVDPQAWNQPDNWVTSGVTNGYPSGLTHVAIISNAVTFTSGVPDSVSRLYTGTGHVSLGKGLNLLHVSPGLNPTLQVGPGGLNCGSGTITTVHSLILTAGGDVVAGALSSSQGGSYTQTGGTWRIANFTLPRTSQVSIPAWSFGGETAIIQTHVNREADTVFDGQPVFENGVRPSWTFSSGKNTGVGLVVDLKGRTLRGNVVSLTRGNKHVNDHFVITSSSNGAVMDINKLVINSANIAPMCHLNLTNAQVFIRGSGTAWDNRSTNQTAFTLLGTTVTFDPDGGTATLDSGSEDRNSTGLDPADWQQNFAVDEIRIGDGDWITLAGNANVGGGATNALYARSLKGLGTGGTLALNGHNVYLLESPENMTFDTSAGGRVYAPSREPGTVVIIR